MIAIVIVTLAIGCKPGSTAPTSSPAPESRPEGIGRVVKVEANEGIGLRLRLATGVVLTVGPPGSQTLVQTATEPDSLAIYGHDRRGLWVLWLGLDPKHGPDCFACRRSASTVRNSSPGRATGLRCQRRRPSAASRGSASGPPATWPVGTRPAVSCPRRHSACRRAGRSRRSLHDCVRNSCSTAERSRRRAGLMVDEAVRGKAIRN